MPAGIAYKDRLRPGERKLLEALMKEENSFTELKHVTGLSSSHLTKYLKLFQKEGVVERDIDSRKYRLTDFGRDLATKNELITQIEGSNSGELSEATLAHTLGIARHLVPYILWEEPREKNVVFQYYYRGKPDQLLEIIRRKHALQFEDWIVDVFSLALARKLIGPKYFEDPSLFKTIPDSLLHRIWMTLFPTMRKIILINKFDPPYLLETLKDPRGKELLEFIFRERRRPDTRGFLKEKVKQP